MAHKEFDRSRLFIRKLSERKNRIRIEDDHIPATREPGKLSPSAELLIRKTAEDIRLAREKRRSVILAFGAHTIKNGLAPSLIALIKEGWITHLATNGAGIIHDWEFAYQGESSEDVKENVRFGQFGIWEETGFYINLALIIGAYEGLGYGESVGKMISQEGLQIPDVSSLYKTAATIMKSDPDLSASAIDLAGIIERQGLKSGYMSVKHPFRKYSVQAAGRGINRHTRRSNIIWR